MPPFVLATKLFVPTPDADVLARPRLTEALSKADGRVVLVSAPAGAGKTTLVADWLRRTNRPVGWISLDAQESDPLAFLTYVVEAFDSVRPSVGRRAAALLASTPPPEPTVAVSILLSELAVDQTPGIIVLEDYHFIDDPDVHDLVALLIERMPPEITLVIATRSDPPLPLARMRARGRLVEVREADLRFDAEETAIVLERYSGRKLSRDSVALLARRTEGWAAGLQLAALALRNARDPEAFIAGFAGTNAFVADYLTDEVVGGLSGEEQSFLIRSSLLHRLSGPLCDAALGHSGSGALLEALSRANLFLVPLDADRQWFRYHHLFGDLLLRRAQSRPVSDRREILLRASAWCRENDQPDDAVRYSIAAGESDTAADLIAAYALNSLAAGEALTTARWIRLLPDEVVRASPDHCVIGAWSHSLIEDHDSVAAYADAAAERQFARDRPYPHIHDLDVHVRTIVAGVLSLDGSRAEEAHDELLAAIREASADNLLLLASAEVMAGNVLGLLGRYQEGLTAFGRCHALAERAGSELLRLAAASGTAEFLLFQGKPRQAVVAADNALGDRHALREILGSQAANLRAVRAMAHLELDDDEAAEADLHRVWSAMGAATDSRDAWAEVARFDRARPSAFHSSSLGVFLGLLVHVRLLIQRGEIAAAAGSLDQLEVRLSTTPNPIGKIVLDTLRVRLWAALPDRTRLQRWLRTESDATIGCAYWDHTAVLTRARAAVSAGDPQSALHLLESLIRELDRGGAGLGLAEARVLEAIAHAAAGQTTSADASTEVALELTSDAGLRRVWLDGGKPVRGLLQSVITRGSASPTALSEAAVIVGALESPASSQPSGIIEISDRELEILRMVAAGHTNQEIAQALFLAVGTVKKHTHNIYQKMGVRSRTQAIRAALEGGVLARRD